MFCNGNLNIKLLCIFQLEYSWNIAKHMMNVEFGFHPFDPGIHKEIAATSNT